MVLIFSSKHDMTTLVVIEWLEYYGMNWVRINGEDKIDLEFLGEDVKFTTSENESFLLSQIKSFWYRRGVFNIGNILTSEIQQFKFFQHVEVKKIVEFLFFKLEKLKSISSFNTSDNNKLITSSIARELKIKTTDDYLFSKSEFVKKLFTEKKIDFITKPIGGEGMHDFEKFTIYNYSKKITLKKITSNIFFPSLIQNYIEKKYELRIFYLDEKFYTMAILSQSDDKTKVDFRNYNKDIPNRTIPFKLPENMEVKIDLLMKKLNLNTGSIDMIVTPKNEFVFLEVNPVGQFGMTSYPCNYNLEEIVANYLRYD